MHLDRIPFPRALARSGSRVFAEQSPQQLFAELQSVIEGRFADYNSQLTNLETALTAIGGGDRISAPELAGADKEYSTAFASYFRHGEADDYLKKQNATGDRATIHAAMSVGSNTDGGYLAPVEWDRKLHEAQRATSPMRRLATVQPTSIGAFTTLWNTDSWGSGWVGETAARPLTSSAQLAPITFAAGEIYAQPAATQRLLDDAALDVEAWLRNSVRKEFDRQEGIAFISGDGVNKPAGFLTFVTGGVNAAAHPGGAIDVITSAINYDGLVDFMYGLDAPYRQNATWLMSSLTAALISKLKDADNLPLWRQSMIVGQPDTLLGRPVEIDEGMPAPTANNMAIAFGDFRAGYLINDRIGTRILRDPFTSKPYVLFYCTKRVGGGVLDPNAIRVLKLPA